MKALLIIDMLNDFVEDWGTLRIDGAKEIIPYIKDLKTQFKRENAPVIYLCDSHDENDQEFLIWPKHCVEGTPGAEVIDELKPEPSDIVIKKKAYSGFFNTNLEDILKSLKVYELYLVGVATNICVHYTAADAVLRGFKVYVPWKGTKGLTEEDKAYMEKQFKNVLKVEVI